MKRLLNLSMLVLSAFVLGGCSVSEPSNSFVESGDSEYDADYLTERDTLVSGGNDMDCDNFDTQSEAQDFFESTGGGDPHGLDRDRDGSVCETLP